MILTRRGDTSQRGPRKLRTSHPQATSGTDDLTEQVAERPEQETVNWTSSTFSGCSDITFTKTKPSVPHKLSKRT